MADENKNRPLTPHELAAQGDPDAQEYLRWVQLKKRKEELLNQLSTTAGVDDKFRDPAFVEAKKAYSGSLPDIARRALELSAMPGNVLKAAIKSPEGASESRMGQISRAIKATTGAPEDAFKENRVEGSDFTDNPMAATAIDMAADVVGGAGAGMGAKAALNKIMRGAASTKSAAKSVANKVAAKIQPIKTAEKELMAERLAAQQESALKGQGQLFSNTELPIQAKPAGLENATEYSIVPNKSLQLEIPKNAETLAKEADTLKSEELLNRLSNASDPMPTTESHASDVLAEKLMGQGPGLDIEAFPNRGAKFFGPEAPVKSNYGTKILAPNEPVTADKLLKGLSEYGTSTTSKLSNKEKKALEKLLKKGAK